MGKISGNSALGYTLYLPTEDRYLMGRSEPLDELLHERPQYSLGLSVETVGGQGSNASKIKIPGTLYNRLLFQFFMNNPLSSDYT
jgi:hypothetical protein